MWYKNVGKIPEFQILGWSQNVTCPDEPSIPLCFKFDFHLVRKAQYYYLKVMFPLWLLVVSSLSAFGIEPEDLSGRLQVLMTLLLSTIAFLYVVQESVPKINHLTVIDQVVIASLGALLLSVLFSYLVSIAPADQAARLNAILAGGYQALYFVVNIILVGPPHRRHNKLRAELIRKQEEQDYTLSGRFKATRTLKETISFGADKSRRMNKSYSLSGGTMTLRGDNDSFRGLNRNLGGDEDKKKNPKNVDLRPSPNVDDGKVDDTHFKQSDQEPSEESSVVFDA